MKNKYLLTALCVIGLAATYQAEAITWDYTTFGNNVALGNSATFTSSGYGLTVYGYTTGGAATALYAKNGGAGEQGLGINSDPKHEINTAAYIQISSLITGSPTATLTSLLFGSVQSGEQANIYGSTAAGTLGTYLGAVTSDGSFDVTAYLSSYTYFGVTSNPNAAYPGGDPNVLIGSVTASVITITNKIPSVPDGGTTVLLLVSSLFCLVLLRKQVMV